jgi:hypothetical protein
LRLRAMKVFSISFNLQEEMMKKTVCLQGEKARKMSFFLFETFTSCL